MPFAGFKLREQATEPGWYHNLRYRQLNNLGGLFVFFISALTYLLTREATVSWWDCGEFLSAARKLEVVHEPGSPLFLMIGRAFSMLATRPEYVASLVNASSALASAATIMLLFWTITALCSRITPVQNSQGLLVILGSGLVGSLAYCFSDTFWFSAVESEVYALSSLCTALVFWAILKWQNELQQGKPRASVWLLFIAYVMGLSIGVHLLNLLSIPAITFVYYFHFYRTNWKSFSITLGLSIFLLVAVLYGLIPLTLSWAAASDILAVNHFGWGFNAGACTFLVLLALALAALLVYSRKTNRAGLHSITLGTVFILVGYASYAMVIIRAGADTPLNNSNPSNFSSLSGYLAREQYQDSPLLYGQNFNAEIVRVERGPMRYRKAAHSYEPVGPKPEYIYDPAACTWFPRMWDSDHAREYRSWTGLAPGQAPDFWNNLNFFGSYQLYYMYARYFLWNFAGRQNDTPSTYPNPTKGNWKSGIGFIDALLLGNQQAVPERMSGNKGNNELYFLPLLLGLAGLIFQIRRDTRGFLVVLLLFLFTGIAIAVYLNMPPSQPRERDYAFAGSFYAFAIWIGLGFAALHAWLAPEISKYAKPVSWLVFSLCLAAVPVLMACREWDDHDRSQKFTARDFSANYLRSCAPNSILFAYGDNETYPLWYAQEVEGIRTDVRVINLSLFDASWAVDKAKKKQNQSEALPISWQHEQYVDGIRDYLYFHDAGLKGYTDLGDLLDFMGSSDKASRNDEGENYLPSKKFSLKINPAEVLGSGTVSLAERDRIPGTMQWTFNHNTISKGQIIILDILQHNHWKRPVYFCATMGSDSYMGMDAYLRQEGIVYRLVPLEQGKHIHNEYPMNEAKTYSSLMQVYRWGNLNKGIHIDDQTNSFAQSFKEVFMGLAVKLYQEGKKDSCLHVLDRCREMIPELPPLGNEISEEDFSDVHMADMYYGLGKSSVASSILRHQLANASQYLDYAASQGPVRSKQLFAEIQNDAGSLLEEMKTICQKHSDTQLLGLIETEIKKAGI